MESKPTFKSRPLIRNAVHPNQLFTEQELGIILASVKRRLALDRYGKKIVVNEEERQTALDLLEIARFHGYYPDRITDNGLRWAVMCESYLPKVSKWSTIITIQACSECSTNFHAVHYQDQEPVKRCWQCERRLKRQKTT